MKYELIYMLLNFAILAVNGCRNPRPLGIENGKIPDSRITASSVWSSQSEAANGRLNFKKINDRWPAWSARTIDLNQWIQFDFQYETIVDKILTQGRDNADQWVKTYTVSHSTDGINFEFYQHGGVIKVFNGNNDRNTIVENSFSPFIVARFVRIHPKSWFNHISIRAEFYGCFKDPFSWVLTHGKQAIQSSTDVSHVASYITDGDYNNFDLPLKYSLTNTEDNPYVQIDLGQSVSIVYLHLAVPMEESLNRHQGLKITVGDDPDVVSTTNFILRQNLTMETWDFQLFPGLSGYKGRYLTIIKKSSNRKLYFTEVTAFVTPTENLAFKKDTTASPTVKENGPDAITDMRLNNYYESNAEKPTWLRVDLDAIFLVVEVLIYARVTCCSRKQLNGVDLRIGNALTNQGNSNPLCATIDLYPGSIRSFYCHMFGRYVNLHQNVDPPRSLSLAEIVINPETTENIAKFTTTYSNTPRAAGQHPAKSITDTFHFVCYSPSVMSHSKRIWIILGAEYDIAMVHIINHPDFLDQTVDFKITVGMSSSYTDSTPCVTGLQSMAGLYFASFFCDQRITGNHVFLFQEPEDKRISVCEVAVFEETKPKISGIKTDQLLWVKEGSDLDLTCNAKGHPVPAVVWVKDNETIANDLDTLQLTNLRINQSGLYECWAMNRHGEDAKPFYVTVAGNDLHLCVKYSEIEYVIGKENDRVDLKGNEWYKFFDSKNKKELQLQNSPPKRKHLTCLAWLSGAHPKAKDGVVKRQLCIRNETRDCSKKSDVFIRRCATHYVYNFRNIHSTLEYPFCFQDVKDVHGGFQPVIASPTRKHMLFDNVFHSEEYISDSYDCLKLCQLAPRCKSFNHSQKFKKCELNSATKKEFPKKYIGNKDFDYFEMGKGTIIAPKQEL